MRRSTKYIFWSVLFGVTSIILRVYGIITDDHIPADIVALGTGTITIILAFKGITISMQEKPPVDPTL